VRLFVAVELTEKARREVAAVQAELRRTSADINWVEPENLHLTLKFLGEIDESRLPALTQALRDAAGPLQPFTISLEGVGAFPRPERPRVLWVGVKDGRGRLVELAEKIAAACALVLRPFDFAQDQHDRPFSPHLTIGRVRSGGALAAIPFKTSEPIRVDRLVLFQSKLSPHGPTYTPLAGIPLKLQINP
jgi:2'-5' RNA ligase